MFGAIIILALVIVGIKVGYCAFFLYNAGVYSFHFAPPPGAGEVGRHEYEWLVEEEISIYSEKTRI